MGMMPTDGELHFLRWFYQNVYVGAGAETAKKMYSIAKEMYEDQGHTLPKDYNTKHYQEYREKYRGNR